VYLLEDGVNESLPKSHFLRMLLRRSCSTADNHIPDCENWPLQLLRAKWQIQWNFEKFRGFTVTP
jgi:hypothetical protein